MSKTLFDPRNPHHRLILRRDLLRRINAGTATVAEQRALALVEFIEALLSDRLTTNVE